MDKVARVTRILLMAAFAASIAACSSLPDWANPDTWGDSSADEASIDSQDTAAQGSQGPTVAQASDKYPVLADAPDKAPPSTSTDEQQQVTDALVGDRAQAQYSGEQLRADSGTGAAPPPPASADAATTTTAATSPASSSGTAAAPPGAAASAPPQAPAAASAVAAPSQPPPSVASTAPAGAARAAPAIASNDAALGFQPSHAPPLDPSVRQLIASPSRYPRLAMTASSSPPTPTLSGTPAATVLLGNGNALDANGLAQVQTAVAAFRANGGQGYVRIVGHAAGSASAAQTLERAQSCATTVARALIKLGVPAKKILVEASGQAEGDQRRADIFLQS